jgi:hypothetical protein
MPQMKSLSELGAAELYWIQPTLKRNYELRADDDLFATLIFETAFGSLATAESAEGVWTFKRVGFFRPRVTVREQGAENDLMVYHPEWGSSEGVFEFVNGETYVWKLANFWATQYQIVNTDGDIVISYTSKIDVASDLVKDQARVEMGVEARDISKLALLVQIGWYLIILQQEDVMATATAVATKAMAKRK